MKERAFCLKGLQPDALVCRPIHYKKLKGLLKRNNVTHLVQLSKAHHIATDLNQINEGTEQTRQPQLPPSISTVIDQFPQVF